MWWLATPAVLMVALALFGLARAPWPGDERRQPAPAGVPARELGAVATVATPARPSTTDAIVADDDVRERPGPDPAPAAAPAAPSLRLPEELEPVAPDVVVATGPDRPEAGRLQVAAHAHVAEGAHDQVPLPAMLDGAPTPAGDDVQAPEPGALYWFGPDGLERVTTLGEARR